MNSNVFEISIIRTGIAPIWARGPFQNVGMGIPRRIEQLPFVIIAQGNAAGISPRKRLLEYADQAGWNGQPNWRRLRMSPTRNGESLDDDPSENLPDLNPHDQVRKDQMRG